MTPSLRDASRLAEITGILSRFGATWALAKAGLAPQAAEVPDPKRLRQALEALGPVFVKLGQILSTRGDLIPPDWAEELAKLRASVTPTPWEEMEPRLNEALGRPWPEVFDRIDRQPLGSASVGQVYAAELANGESVVIKITRPAQEDRIFADLRLLEYAAQQAERASQDLRRYQPIAMVRELARAITAEFDLSIEAENTESVSANLAALPKVRVPRIYREFSSRDMLVQERIKGIPPASPEALAKAGLDGPSLARTGAEAFMQMLLVDRLFHADPHPGNMFALEGNEIAFIDFGMVGRLTKARQGELTALLRAIVAKDAQSFARLLMRWSGAGLSRPSPNLEIAAERFIQRHATKGLDLARAIADIMEMVREADLSLPADLVLLFKALATADGTMKMLDPAFDTIAAAKPFVMREMMGKASPEEVTSRLADFAEAATAFSAEAPDLLRKTLARLSEGKLHVEMTSTTAPLIARSIERAGRGVATGFVIAALILTFGKDLIHFGPQVLGLPIGSWAGLGLVVLVGARALLIRRR